MSTQSLVYIATSTTSSNRSVYYGTSEEEFKIRHKNHTKSFRQRKCMNETEVLITIYHGKSTKRPQHNNGLQSVALCLPEKVLIIRADPDTLLNKRTELISKCRHRNNFLLANVKKHLSPYGF